MFIFLILIGIYVFFKTVSYGIYEIKSNNNKSGGIVVIAVGIIGSILPNIVMMLVNQ